MRWLKCVSQLSIKTRRVTINLRNWVSVTIRCLYVPLKLAEYRFAIQIAVFGVYRYSFDGISIWLLCWLVIYLTLNWSGASDAALLRLVVDNNFRVQLWETARATRCRFRCRKIVSWFRGGASCSRCSIQTRTQRPKVPKPNITCPLLYCTRAGCWWMDFLFNRANNSLKLTVIIDWLCSLTLGSVDYSGETAALSGDRTLAYQHAS